MTCSAGSADGRGVIRCTGSERGGALLTALLVTIFVTMAVLTVTHEMGSRLRGRTETADAGRALAGAQAGLETAVDMAWQLDTWRATFGNGTWISGMPIAAGTLSVTADDPADGSVSIDGTIVSSDADTVRLSASANVHTLTRTLAADYVPLPDSVLRYVAVGGGDLTLNSVALEGRARANGDVLDGGNGAILGNITIVSGASVDTSLVDGDTMVHEVPLPLAIPSVDLGWFVDAGEQISLPITRLITLSYFSNQSNPLGNISPDAIYWIDAGGGDVTFRECGVDATIAILNAGTVEMRGAGGLPTFYYHRSPDPDRLPALLVEGNLAMAIDGLGNFTLITPLGPLVLASALNGAFYCTGDFDGPQISSVFQMPVAGCLVAGGDLYLRGSAGITTIQHDPALNVTPLAGLAGRGLRLVPGTTREP